MKVLIACEYSGVIRDAFIEAGHEAWSVDLLPSEGKHNQYHYQGDVRECEKDIGAFETFDLLIAHPDCTYLTNSAAWAYKEPPYHQKVKPDTPVGKERVKLREEALEFVQWLMDLPIKRKCIENPMGIISTRIRKPNQYIHPHEYGHDASKKTGLWLEELPELKPTEFIKPRMVCKCGQVYEPDYFEKRNRLKIACVVCVVNGKGSGRLNPRWANQTDSGQNKLTPSADRWKDRAKTYQGWANAMVDQWGNLK